MRNKWIFLAFAAVFLALMLLLLPGCRKKESPQLKFLSYEIVERVNFDTKFINYAWSEFEWENYYCLFEPTSKQELTLFMYNLNTGKIAARKVFPIGEGPGDLRRPIRVCFLEGHFYLLDLTSKRRLAVYDRDWKLKKLVYLNSLPRFATPFKMGVDRVGEKVAVFLSLRMPIIDEKRMKFYNKWQIKSFSAENGEELHTFAEIEYEDEKLIGKRKSKNFFFLPWQTFALDRKRKKLYVVKNSYSPVIEIYDYNGKKKGQIKLPLVKKRIPEEMYRKVKGFYDKIAAEFYRKHRFKIIYEPYSEYLPFIKEIEIFNRDFLFVYSYDYDFNTKRMLVHLIDLNTLRYKGSLWLPSSHEEYRRHPLPHILNPSSTNYYIFDLTPTDEAIFTRLKLKISLD